MSYQSKLFLYSLGLSEAHFKALNRLVGKDPENIKFAFIENATDVIENSQDWVGGIRSSFEEKGYQIETIDLREFVDHSNSALLSAKLIDKDVIWLCGGHTYYLRWILKASGADSIIKKLVKNGKVFAGWSAGAIMAGPTTLHFEQMGDDPKEADEFIDSGLSLTQYVIVPHMDNPDFSKGAEKTNSLLKEDGFETIPLIDNQVVIIEGEKISMI